MAQKPKDPTELEHVSRFNDVAERHTEDLNNNLRLAGGDSQFFYQAKIAQIRKHLKAEPRVILDFGCGVGTLTRMLADAFPSAVVTGYDPSEKGIAIAAQEHATYGSRLNFVFDLSAFGAKADLIVAAGVFHHIPPSQTLPAMEDISRSLTPDGQVFVFEHNPISPLTRLIVALAAVDRGAVLIYPGQMKRLMGEAKIGGVDLRFISFFPPFMRPLLWLEPYPEWLPLAAQ